jgi:CBS domain-containing protein
MSNQPLAEVMEVLSHGVHRVLVFDHDDQPQMLTQMDLVRFLVSHLNELGPVVHKSLVQLALASEDAVFEHFHKGAKERNIDHAYENIPSSSSISSSIPAPTPPAPPPPVQRRPSITERLRYLTPSSTALAGFQSMHPPYAASSQTGDVTALPIVNPANFSLLSTLSASDLRPVTMERAHLLALPVMDFLRELWLLKGKEVSKEGEVRKDREEEQRVPYIFQVVSKGDASLGRVMREMVEDEVHRSWVVDELGRVVGVVTLSDVIGKLSPFDKERGTVGIGGREEKWQDGERKGQ